MDDAASEVEYLPSGPANGWPVEKRVQALLSVLMAEAPSAVELGVSGARVLTRFRVQHAVPPGRWISLRCSDPSLTPTPEWFVRETSGHGESRQALGPDEQVYATLTFLPGEPLKTELRRLHDELQARHPLRERITWALRASEPGYNEAVFRESFAEVRRGSGSREFQDLLAHHQIVARDITEDRKMRVADGWLFGSVVLSAQLLSIASRKYPSEPALLAWATEYCATDEQVWEALGTLARSLLDGGRGDILLEVVDLLREDTGRLMKAAAHADAVPTWANLLYKAAPMSFSAFALLDMVATHGPASMRTYARNAYRAEEERSAVVRTALANHALDVLDGSSWTALRRRVARIQSQEGTDAARRYVESQIVNREARYPRASVTELLDSASA